MTAAHCLDDDFGADPVTRIQFILPSFGDAIAGDPVTIFEAINWASNPLYAGGIDGLIGGYDLALFTLDAPAVGFDTYGLYLGNPLNPFTMVGNGTIGGPAGTGQGVPGQDYRLREGNNIFELRDSDLFIDGVDGVALYDFDNGLLQNDVFGRNLGMVQLGVANEASASPGDSGGPSFIAGRIAAVTSWGLTGGIFQGFCGGSSTDPFNRFGTTAVVSLANCTNSSVGEIGGNTLVANNMDFIRSYVGGAVVVPEPATWAMLIAGFGLVGFTARRRRGTEMAKVSA